MKTLHLRYHSKTTHWLRLAVSLVFSVVGAESLQAQLTWGVGGAGGAGTWDTTTLNWWNGAANVAWNGGSAVFAGTGATVTSTFPGPAASSLVFNAPGYTIQSGWVTGSASGLTVTTNSDATIGSTLSKATAGPTLTKNGAGMLAVSGTNFFQNLQIDAGEYRVAGTSSLFFSNVTLANAPEVVVTLGGSRNSNDIRSLAGGGANGGIVQPDAQARTVTLTLWRGGSFGGVLQDNGAGKLALTIFESGTPVVLAAANTYSGLTTVNLGTLAFAGAGSALNTAASIASSGTFRLDNSAGALADRFSDTAPVTSAGGRLELLGHSVTPVNEQLGTLTYRAATKLAVTSSGAAALLTFAGASRTNRGTLEVTGSGRATWRGIAGLLSSGSAAGEIQGGTLSADVSEFVMTNRNALTIGSSIGQTVEGTGLTKTGAGTLTLTGSNSYSGNTAIIEGTLAVSSDGNLGTGSAVEINGGTLLATTSFSSAKGLSNGISQVGKVDTAGNQVSFSGARAGTIDKRGIGTLTLPMGATGSNLVSEGTLSLPNAVSGTGQLFGGTLRAAGTLNSISLLKSSTLDLGGAGAATLASGLSLSGGSGAQLTIDFGVGSGSSDHWSITGAFPFLSPSSDPLFLFDFRNLGGVTTAADYLLIDNVLGSPVALFALAFAPSALSAGWSGIFTSTPTAISVRFTTVPAPEPGSALLLAAGAVAVFGWRPPRRN